MIRRPFWSLLETKLDRMVVRNAFPPCMKSTRPLAEVGYITSHFDNNCSTSKNTTSRRAGQMILKLLPFKTGNRECIEISRGFDASFAPKTCVGLRIAFVGRVSNESFRYSPISDLPPFFGESR
jgi:hypothetical protein